MKKKSIRCNETGAVYASMLDAAKELCISQANLVSYFKGRRKTVAGLTFSEATEALKTV